MNALRSHHGGRGEARLDVDHQDVKVPLIRVGHQVPLRRRGRLHRGRDVVDAAVAEEGHTLRARVHGAAEVASGKLGRTGSVHASASIAAAETIGFSTSVAALTSAFAKMRSNTSILAPPLDVTLHARRVAASADLCGGSCQGRDEHTWAGTRRWRGRHRSNTVGSNSAIQAQSTPHCGGQPPGRRAPSPPAPHVCDRNSSEAGGRYA